MPSTTVDRTAAVPGRELRRRSALLAAALLAALALILVAVAAPADGASAAVPAAKPPDKPGSGGGGGTVELEYAAVGDSFAAGTGAGSYLTGSPCYQSSKSYPKLLDADRKAKLLLAPSDFAACSGASTVETVTQVSGISITANVVTVTVGGNDVGFADVMRECFGLFPTSSCQSSIDTGAAIAASQDFRDDVAGVITAIRNRTEPDAKVIVAGYPLLFDSNSSYAWADEVNAETAVLNDVIESVAIDNGAAFVDVEDDFAGHGVGSSSPWINGLSLLRQHESFHPNSTGQAAYATAIRAVPMN
jgi:lysophospholipase L1-like esterase